MRLTRYCRYLYEQWGMHVRIESGYDPTKGEGDKSIQKVEDYKTNKLLDKYAL